MDDDPLFSSLRAANLLPSPLIPSNFNPIYNLTVGFPATTPENGSLVRKGKVQEQPTITITPRSPSSSTSQHTLTLALLDPDAPTPADPKYAFWRHWLVTGIPGAETSSFGIEAGKTLTQWLAPGPKDDSGPHRYLYLLFAEPQGRQVTKDDVGGEEFVDRRSFSAVEFVQKWGLELVGVQWMKGVGDGWQQEAA